MKNIDGRFGSPNMAGIQPEWIRLPKSGTLCPHTGLSRSAMNGLILGKAPKVKSKVFKQDGKGRGIRLVNYRSLLDYIDQCPSA